MRVLLVEDCYDQRTLYTRFLEEFGHTVTSAKDGEEALALIESSQECWDALVSDFNMPRMNGVELISEVVHRSIPFHKIILFSGTATSPEFTPLKKLLVGQHRFHFVHKDEGVERLDSVIKAQSF
jgi:CheY-like chemotaxis protein